MPDRTQGHVEHVRWIKHRDGHAVSVRVVELTQTIVDFWEEHVQRVIDTHPAYKARADRGWRWSRYIGFSRAGIAEKLRQRPCARALVIEHEGQIIPCGLVLVLAKYPSLEAHRHRSVFVWYLAGAPAKVLLEAGLVPPNKVPAGVIEPLLDIAITLSFKALWQGRTGLHADPKGEDDLLKRYEDDLRMTRLPLQMKLPLGRRFTGNDGRYFYYPPAQALERSELLDPNRVVRN